MLAAALNPSMQLCRQKLCAYVFLLAVGAYAPALFAAPQHGGAPQHSGMPRGEKHESHREIDQLEEKWRNAVMTANTAAMDSMLADDFISIGANGTLHTKEETLARLSSVQKHIASLELSDSKVRFYGTTALVTSLAHVTGVNLDGEAIGDFRYTHVYVRNAQGKWKMVSSETSRIREPGARK